MAEISTNLRGRGEDTAVETGNQRSIFNKFKFKITPLATITPVTAAPAGGRQKFNVPRHLDLRFFFMLPFFVPGALASESQLRMCIFFVFCGLRIIDNRMRGVVLASWLYSDFRGGNVPLLLY